ncbi:hypothetical protein [Afifella sp. IM 167]|uniref:hypothetical protein n=1 Tax=Afifella sp. IM 167 TaxID=2033586 RepID=UPI001CCE2E66|nr:hypothetical protein [Afifella sp. IM 167]MBZ8133199.1 hypothetical protein [Afifella sp. IM 167]
MRLEWRRTWPDEPNRREDFVARCRAGYCRVYRTANGPPGRQWYWCAADTRNRGSGLEASAGEAAARAEAALLDQTG